MKFTSKMMVERSELASRCSVKEGGKALRVTRKDFQSHFTFIRWLHFILLNRLSVSHVHTKRSSGLCSGIWSRIPAPCGTYLDHSNSGWICIVSACNQMANGRRKVWSHSSSSFLLFCFYSLFSFAFRQSIQLRSVSSIECSFGQISKSKRSGRNHQIAKWTRRNQNSVAQHDIISFATWWEAGRFGCQIRRAFDQRQSVLQNCSEIQSVLSIIVDRISCFHQSDWFLVRLNHDFKHFETNSISFARFDFEHLHFFFCFLLRLLVLFVSNDATWNFFIRHLSMYLFNYLSFLPFFWIYLLLFLKFVKF